MADENAILNSKKYEYSFVRFSAMLMIFLCHVCEWFEETLKISEKIHIFGDYFAIDIPIFLFMLRIGVQVFLFLSGVLYGRKKDLLEEESGFDFIFRNFCKILRDYLIYTVLVLIPVYFIFFRDLIGHDAAALLKTAFRLLTGSGTIEGVNHFWFIPYILLCYLLTPLLHGIKKRTGQSVTKKFFVMLGVMALLEIIGAAFDSYFNIAWINCYVIGFFGCDIVSEMKKPLRTGLFFAGIVLGIPAAFVWYAVLTFYLPGSSGVMRAICNVAVNYSRLFVGLIVFLVLLAIGKRFAGIFSGGFKKLLELSDKYSYDVFIVHMLYVKGALSLMRFTPYYSINILLVITATVISALLLSVIGKGFSKILLSIFRRKTPSESDSVDVKQKETQVEWVFDLETEMMTVGEKAFGNEKKSA